MAAGKAGAESVGGDGGGGNADSQWWCSRLQSERAIITASYHRHMSSGPRIAYPAPVPRLTVSLHALPPMPLAWQMHEHLYLDGLVDITVPPDLPA